jgi:hypothetical protein
VFNNKHPPPAMASYCRLSHRPSPPAENFSRPPAGKHACSLASFNALAVSRVSSTGNFFQVLGGHPARSESSSPDWNFQSLHGLYVDEWPPRYTAVHRACCSPPNSVLACGSSTSTGTALDLARSSTAVQSLSIVRCSDCLVFSVRYAV